MSLKSAKTTIILLFGILIPLFLFSCKVDVPEDASDGYSDTTSPTIISVSPADGSTDVLPIPTDFISVEFSEAMDVTNLSTTTFTVNDGSNDISGTYSCSGSICSFSPSDSLHYNDNYTVTLSSGIKDVGGAGLAGEYYWSFSTKSAVVSVSPVDGSTDVDPKSVSSISVTFVEEMDETSLTTDSFIVNDGSNDLSGSYSCSNSTCSFSPAPKLNYNTTYTITLFPEIRNSSGAELNQSHSWNFSTSSFISSVSPTDGSTDVSIEETVISVTFNEDLDASTVTTDTVTLSNGTNAVTGTISVNDNLITFTPSTYLKSSTSHVFIITTDITDQAGYSLGQNYSWSFSMNSFNATSGTFATVKNFSRPVTLSTNLSSNNNVVYSVSTAPANGSIDISGATATYTPINNYTGPDSFTFKANNSIEDSSPAIISITINTRLPDTGQTGDYTATTGEDSDYSINPPSYTDNGNGTVTDNITGLIWQKSDDTIYRNWFEAETYCNDLTLGEVSDWRLPLIKENVSIVDKSSYNPARNSIFSGNTASEFWSSTDYVGEADSALILGIWDGGVFYRNKYTNKFVRCVRGVERIGPSFYDNGDGTVTDFSTGLVWQQGEGGSKTWELALNYCEGLHLGGKTDWRLPNSKELISIVNYDRQEPSLGPVFFPNAQSSDYITSTTYMNDTLYFWYVGFDNGWMGGCPKTESINVRCVRGGQ
jgi:uncharacterized protein DUF1566/Big-like domain-containing protein